MGTAQPSALGAFYYHFGIRTVSTTLSVFLLLSLWVAVSRFVSGCMAGAEG